MQHKYLINDNDPDIAYVLETHPDLTPDILFEEIDGKFTLRKQSIKKYIYSEFSRMNDFFNLELLSKYIYYLHAECIKKSKVQGKVYDALVAFGWRFIGEEDITENLSGEVKQLYSALQIEFEKCGSIYSETTDDSSFYGEDNAIKEYATKLSDSMIAFLDKVDIPSNINIKNNTKKRNIIKAHFARAWLVEPAIKMLKKIDKDTSEPYLIDLVGFMCMVFGTAAFFVLSKKNDTLSDRRSKIKSPDEYSITNQRKSEFQGTTITDLAVRKLARNLYIKLVIYYLERNWVHVSALYSTPEKPFAYTIENLLLVLISICDDVFICDGAAPIDLSSRPKLDELETRHEIRVMRRMLNTIIGKDGPLLPEPTSNENAI